MSSPTQRTLAHFRKLGFPLVEVVEKWIPGANIRKDFAGFVDVIAIDEIGNVWAVQATSGPNVSARVKKITDSPMLAVLRLANWSVIVQGWTKKKGRYVLREVNCS